MEAVYSKYTGAVSFDLVCEYTASWRHLNIFGKWKPYVHKGW